MSVTGVLLAYERQLIAAVDGVVRVAPLNTASTRLPLDTLLVRAGVPTSLLASVVVNADPTIPLLLRQKDRSTVALDPYRGEVIPSREPGRAQATMTWLRGWHRWLGAGVERRPVLRAVVGASNAAFLLLLLTGAVLWLPRRLSVHALRRALTVRPRLQGRARDWNWHTTAGIWCAVPLAVIVLSGLFISYRWPGLLLDRMAGNAEERAAAKAPSRTEARDPQGKSERDALRPLPSGMQRWLQTATSAVPGWALVTITMPAAADSLVRVAVATPNTYRPDHRVQLRLSLANGQLIGRTDYASQSPSRRLQGWVRFGHTGEVFGLAGQTVALLASAAGMLLVWTGLALSWRRLRLWRRQRATARSIG